MVDISNMPPKRVKENDSADEREIDWQREYLKKDAQLTKSNDDLAKLSRELVQEKDFRIAEARKMGKFEAELTQANTDLLRIKEKMSPRGAIEFFEERGSSLSINQSKLSRGDKWKFFYQNDYKGFKSEMQLVFPSLCSMTPIQQDDFVVDLIRQSYGNTSCFHHSFDLQEGVFICPSDYTPDQMNVLKVVCKCLPCKYNTI